jgi:hypothetical protein
MDRLSHQLSVFTLEDKELHSQQPISRCPVIAGLQTLLHSTEMGSFSGYGIGSQPQISVTGDLHIQLIPSQPQLPLSEEALDEQGVSLVLVNSGRGQVSSSQKPFFITRLSLSEGTPVDQLKVQQSGDMLLVQTGGSQQGKKTRHILTLPQSIRKDLLQVKLSKSGELVVFAPQKFNCQEQQTRPCGSHYLPLEMDQLQHQPNIIFPNQMWNSIPIHQSTRCNISLFPETTEMSSCCKLSKFQEMTQQYIRLWEKIFSPSLVVAKLVPSLKSGSRQTVVLHIKLVDFRSYGGDVEPVRVHGGQPNVLIVESEDPCSPREIPVPQWLKVSKLGYHLDEERSVLRIKLPFRGETVCSRHVPTSCIILTGKGPQQSTTGRGLSNIFVTKSPQLQRERTQNYRKFNSGCQW